MHHLQPYLVVDDSLQQTFLLVACGTVQGSGAIHIVVHMCSIHTVHSCMMPMCAHHAVTFNNFTIRR